MEKKEFQIKELLKKNIVPLCAAVISAVIFIFSVINHGQVGGLQSLPGQIEANHAAVLGGIANHDANATGRFDSLGTELTAIKDDNKTMLTQLDTYLSSALEELLAIRSDLNTPSDSLSNYTVVLNSISDSISGLSKKMDDFNSKLDKISVKLDTLSNKMDDLSVPVSIPATPVPLGTAVSTAAVTEGFAKAGDTVVIRVYAPDVKDMYGYQFSLYYDKAELTYTEKKVSKIDGLDMIFARGFNDYVLVGCTKIGSVPGYSGSNVDVCEVQFTAVKDCELSDLVFSIKEVNIVDSAMNYDEGIENWSCTAAVGKQQ